MSTLPALNFSNSCVEDSLEFHEASLDSNKNWKVIVIDDENTEHLITKVFLKDIVVDGQGVDIIDGYSAKEASSLLQEHPDVAVVIVDVVMETKFSGFEVIRYLRETLHNRYARIIIRSGSTCSQVNLNSIQDYDVSAQAEKAEMTAGKLQAMVTSAIEKFTELQAQHCIKKVRFPLKKKAALGQLIKFRVPEVSLDQENDTATLSSWEWNAKTNTLKLYSKSSCFSKSFPSNTHFCMQDLFATFTGLNKQIAVTTIETAIHNSHSFDFEHFISGKNGAAQLIRHQGRALIDPESGELVKMLGVMQNHSSVRRNKSCREKLSNAVDQVTDSIVIMDSIGQVEYVNTAFTKISAYDETDIIGKNIDVMKSDLQADYIYEQLWETLASGKVFTGTFINRKKDGEIYYEKRTVTPIKDVAGIIVNFISSGTDVTESIKAKTSKPHVVHHDELTGLPNGFLLEDRLSQAIARARWNKKNIGIVYIELVPQERNNQVAAIGNSNELYQSISDRLTSGVRDGDSVCRLGENLFAVLLVDVASSHDIEPIANHLVQSINDIGKMNDWHLSIDICSGVSMFPRHGNDAKNLLQSADLALQLDKESHDNKNARTGVDDNSLGQDRYSTVSYSLADKLGSI